MPRRCRINDVMNLRESADHESRTFLMVRPIEHESVTTPALFQLRSALTNIDELFLRRRFAPADGRLRPRADRAIDGNV